MLTWVIMGLSLAYINPHLSNPGLQIPTHRHIHTKQKAMESDFIDQLTPGQLLLSLSPLENTMYQLE